MSKWTINKSFNIAYGHSVWQQTLDSRFATECKLGCRHFHGHNADVTVFVESEELDFKGMVIDFKELGFVKKFLDDVVDHKMIVDINDPALSIFFPLVKDKSYLVGNKYYSFIDYSLYNRLSTREQEVYSGLIIVDFIPTSENLAKWIFGYVQDTLGDFAKVKKVQLWETPKSCAEYSI